MHDGAVHVKGTGSPAKKGKRLRRRPRGRLPGAKSDLIFWDLDRGDETLLTDADGERHTYEVFDKFVVDPGAVRVRRPVNGKSEVSLKTRSLPDYSRRLIVQGKLKSAG